MSGLNAEKLQEDFPLLKERNEWDWNSILPRGRLLKLNKNKRVLRAGEACQYFVLVLEGTVRVVRYSEQGHEITLYRVGKGETCELSTTCLLADQYYPAEAITETSVHVLLIPKEAFQLALSDSKPFRSFVFASLDKGVGQLVSLVENVAFGPLDRRLAHCLISMMDASGVIIMTHQSLAAELATAREVVSRLLKSFERKGWVELGRGKIRIVDLRELCKLSSHHLCNIVTESEDRTQ